MKTLNFTAVEVLPALLNKTKTQTIRPAWKFKSNVLGMMMPNGKTSMFGRLEIKPARFKVGDKVKLYWNQRSSAKLFCSCCGKPMSYLSHGHPFCSDKTCNGWALDDEFFSKILGEVEITEVFKITMHKDYLIVPFMKSKKRIAIRDGFKNVKEMFKWFDTHYGLSVSKDFWVYRWRWL